MTHAHAVGKVLQLEEVARIEEKIQKEAHKEEISVNRMLDAAWTQVKRKGRTNHHDSGLAHIYEGTNLTIERETNGKVQKIRVTDISGDVQTIISAERRKGEMWHHTWDSVKIQPENKIDTHHMRRQDVH